MSGEESSEHVFGVVPDRRPIRNSCRAESENQFVRSRSNGRPIRNEIVSGADPSSVLGMSRATLEAETGGIRGSVTRRAASRDRESMP